LHRLPKASLLLGRGGLLVVEGWQRNLCESAGGVPADLSLLSIMTIADEKGARDPMASMSDFVGQPLTWVWRRKFYELMASNNSVIATFPAEKKYRFALGLGGARWKKAKALVPDGTGVLFLNEEGHRPDWHVAIYSVKQGPCLAVYDEPWLVFDDGRRFRWERAGFSFKYLDRSGEGAWMDEDRTKTYVQIRDGMREHRVDISAWASKMRDPELSLLLVLGLYNIFIENRGLMLENIK
jgi:hypothetical protein